MLHRMMPRITSTNDIPTGGSLHYLRSDPGDSGYRNIYTSGHLTTPRAAKIVRTEMPRRVIATLLLLCQGLIPHIVVEGPRHHLALRNPSEQILARVHTFSMQACQFAIGRRLHTSVLEWLRAADVVHLVFLAYRAVDQRRVCEQRSGGPQRLSDTAPPDLISTWLAWGQEGTRRR